MIIRRVLTSKGDLGLTEVQFIGVSGQVCGTTYEINSPEKPVFTNRAEATAAFEQLVVVTPDLAWRPAKSASRR